jgi:hypothetical protein
MTALRQQTGVAGQQSWCSAAVMGQALLTALQAAFLVHQHHRGQVAGLVHMLQVLQWG